MKNMLKENMMIICGMELKNSEIRMVLLKGSKEKFYLIRTKPCKLVLKDDTSQEEVNAFKESVYAFLRENKVGLVAIKQRQKRGDWAGGPISFKLEAIIQLYNNCEVKIIHPNTITAAIRKKKPKNPSKMFKYQSVAFELAFALLPDAI